jgi:MFS family permease
MTVKPGTFASALRNRNVAGLLLVHSLGSAAVGIGAVVVSVGIYQETNSSLWASVGVATRVAPFIALSPLTSALADRFDNVKLLRTLMLFEAVSAVVLSMVMAGGFVIASALCGLVLHTFRTPAYPTAMVMVPKVVDADDLAPTTALLTTSDSLAWIAGPGLGGLMCAALGVQAAALVAAAMSVAAAASTFLLHIDKVNAAIVDTRIIRPTTRGSLSAALKAITSSRATAVAMALVGATNFASGASQVLLLVAAAKWLGMGESGFGALSSAVGAGGVAALIIINRVARSSHTRVIAVGCALAVGAPYAVVGASTSVPIALGVLAVSGLAFVLTEVLALTAFQRATAGRELACIFGIFDALTVGAMLVGTMVAAPLVEWAGIRTALVVIGIVVPLIGVLCVPFMGERSDQAIDLEALSTEIGLLAALPMLRTASRISIEALAVSARHQRVRSGKTIVHQGEAADDFFTIVSGTVDVTVTSSNGKRVVVNKLGAGDGFGELGVLRGSPRAATVTATSDVELLRIAGADLLKSVGPGDVYGGAGMSAAIRNYVITS